MMIYIILILISLTLILLEIKGKRKRKLRVAKKRKFEFNNHLIRKLDKIVSKNELTEKLKKYYVDKLGVLNTNKKIQNTGIAVSVILGSLIFTLMTAILLTLVMNVWYVILIISALTLYFINYGFILYLNTQLKKIHKQFPIALQLFTDSYITNNNIKVALNESYSEMPTEIGMVFEKLARRLSSGHEQRKYIIEFADNLNYVWGHAFAEILLLSLEGTGDIGDDLLFLNELVSDDLQDDEETKSEMSTNKMLFMAINGCTVVAFILNIFFNPIASELYFYTQTGNIIVMFWIAVIALGMGISTVLDHI
jgi:Flp pilus assembly protein TadB